MDNGTIIVTATVTQQPSCGNNDGEITVAAPIGSQYEYRLSTSISWQIASTFSNLEPGRYTVEVKDGENKGIANLVLSDENQLKIEIERSEPTCENPQASTNSFTVKATGCSPPYDFSIDGGTTWEVFNETEAFFEDLVPREYQIKVRDAEGITASTSYSLKGEDLTPPTEKEILEDPAATAARRGVSLTKGSEYYIAPNGKAIILPQGAEPAFFRFGGSWGIPAEGTLQGFKIGNETYFAELVSYTNTFLRGYRKIPLNPVVYYENTHPEFYPAQFGLHEAIYFRNLEGPVNCGVEFVPFNYNFSPECLALPQITPVPDENIEPTKTVYWKDQSNCGRELIAKDNFKGNDAGLDPELEEKLRKLLEALNANLGSQLKLSFSAVKEEDVGKAKEEAQSKGLIQTQAFNFDGKHILGFTGQGFSQCEKDYIEVRMNKLQNALAYKVGLTDLDKFLVDNASYMYFGFFGMLNCSTAEEKYYNCDANGENCTLRPGASTTKAFAAGMAHSIIEDIDIIENLSLIPDIIDMALEASKGVANSYLLYPKDLYEAYQTIKGINDGNTESLLNGDLFYKLTPPPKLAKKHYDLLTNAASFMWKHYTTDANYWRSGELTAMVGPIVLTGGAYLAAKTPALAGRVSKIFAKADDLADFFKAGKKLDYADIAQEAGDDIKQVIKRETDDAIENIYEESPPRSGDYIKICGSCLAQNTAVFGSDATLENLQPLTTVQTLEKDGSIGTRNVWGKVGRKVSEYVKIFVGKDELQSTTEHEFKTAEGWKSASYLRKGALLFSLALNSFVPIDSVALVHEPLEVEGLSLGDVQGYGVGSLGVVTATSPSCLLGFTQNHYNKVQSVLDPAQEKKFIDYLNSNDNLESIKGLKDIAVSSAEQAEVVAKAFKRVEDMNLPGLQLKKKGFPSNSNRPEVYNAAKAYQAKFSGNADLSFEYNGISFDDIENGKLIDAKFGYGNSTFSDVDVEIGVPDVINVNLRDALIASAERQTKAITGTTFQIEWKVSSDLAQRGISSLLADAGYNINVIFVRP